MRHCRLKSLLSLVLLGACAPAFGQTNRTLADFLTQNNPNPNGAALAVEPDRVKPTKNGDTLEDFHRKEVTLGNLVAIVPEQMVVIDDSFQQAPNLYDGLDRSSKVLYLLTTLTPSQWDLISKAGIGMSELDDAQKKVFVSLLPKELDWHSWQVGQFGMGEKEVSHGEVKEGDLASVKLYVRRQMLYHVKLAANQGISDFRETGLTGNAGATVFDRDSDAGKPDAFGVLAKASVDNEAKPSDLDYSANRLKALVKLPQSATVNDLLAQVHTLTGYEVHADLRVANRSVWLSGSQAQAGQLLKALALAVTGTYRQVGSAYVLTSDLIGLGTRKLRFALWGDELRDRQYKLDNGWRSDIDKSGRLKGVGFQAGDPVAPTGELVRKLDEADTGWGSGEWIPSAEMTSGMRTFLTNMAHMYRAQNWDLSSVQLNSTYNYGFVLPSGEPLKPENDELGFAFEFHPQPSVPHLESPNVAQLPLQTVSLGSGVIANPSSQADADAWVQLAADKGFSELWLTTLDREILRHTIAEAAKVHIAIKLAVYPWWAPKGLNNSEPDRTILGEGASEVLNREEQSTDWQNRVFKQHDPFEATFMPTISPTDPARETFWSKFLALGKLQGLGGVVLLHTAPFGYEGKSNGNQRELSGAMARTQAFGYTTAQRLAFLRAKGVDPIDIAYQYVLTDPDLRQPFFYTEAMMGNTSVYNGEGEENPAMGPIPDDWDAYLGDLNAKAIQSLANSFLSQGQSVQVEASDELVNIVDYLYGRHVSPWSRDSGLPKLDIHIRAPEDAMVLVEISTKDKGPAWDRGTLKFMNERKFHPVFNFSQFPISEASSYLDHLVADKSH